MTEATVYIIDDDEAVRDSIKELVESVNLNAETFASANSFLEVYSQERTGCLVLDIRMARMSGLVLQERLNEMDAKLPIIFITGHGDVDMAVEAFKSGAVDFIQKPYHEQSLLDSINDALELDASTRNKNQQAEALEQHRAELTTREREVMDLLLQGNTNNLIGESLGISPRTVEVHRQHILQKYNVKSVTQLMYALNQGVA
ncbi:MAG: response regulator [Gammaproteobacteria bacterium]|nr:response regulator [Gammaproteobacteria bacterium]